MSNLTIEFAAKAAKACEACKLFDPETELPALVTFAEAAELHREASHAYETARAAWGRFSATNPSDDPAHEEHRQTTLAARQALNAAQEQFDVALVQLRTARGDAS